MRMNWLRTALRQRAHDAIRQSRSEPDSGVAMVMIMGIMLLCALLSVTIVSATAFNTTFTVQTREVLQTAASADAGLDLVLEQLEGKRYDELHTVCSQDLIVNDDEVAIVTEYKVKTPGGLVTKPCPLPSDITQSLRVFSTATTSNNLTGRDDVTRTAVADVVPTPPQVSLDKAIFSEGSLIITNGSEIISSGDRDDEGNPIYDAHVYSNGNELNCRASGVGAEGSVVAAYGNVNLSEGNCHVRGDLWAGGNVNINTSVTVSGDVFAAGLGNPAIRVGNGNATIQGSALANGTVRVQDAQAPRGINGTAFSFLGAVELTNQAAIGGSAYARTGISMGQGRIGYDGLTVTGNITGNSGARINGTARAGGSIASAITAAAKHPNSTVSIPQVPNPGVVFPSAVGYPGQIQPPPREPMPRVDFEDDDIALWQGAGWALETYTNQCSQALSIINDPGASWTSPRLLNFEGCSSPIQFNNGELKLKGSLAIIAPTGITSSNVLKIAPTVTDEIELFWIVPGNAPGVSWNSVGGGQVSPVCGTERNISIDNVEVNKNGSAQNVSWMLYSPCRVRISNQITNLFRGQIYAGSVQMPNNSKIKMSQVPVPSLADSEPNLTDEADMRLISRYDFAG